MLKFEFKPFDVLFFGSGKPFNRGDDASSIFPPFPHTLAGAISQRLTTFSKIESSRTIKFIFGPFVKRLTTISEEETLFFPAPSNIYTARKEDKPDFFCILNPFENMSLKLFLSQNTNKPNTIYTFCVYTKDETEIEPFNGFVSMKYLKHWLDGTLENKLSNTENKVENKNNIIKLDEICQNDERIGIKINPEQGTVEKDSGVYRVSFKKLKTEPAEEFSLVVWAEFDLEDENLKKANLGYEQIKAIFEKEPHVLKVGGESKTVFYKLEESSFFDEIKDLLETENTIVGFLKCENDSLSMIPKKVSKIEKGEKVQFLFLTHGVSGSFLPDLLRRCGFRTISMTMNGCPNVTLYSSKSKRFFSKAIPAGTVIWTVAEKDIEISSENACTLSQNNFIGSNLVLIRKE
ncbi:type III-B CRISPR module-associated protein Cmr3 [Caldicellulosiruptor morganii]|uniref:Type III-B CRISPR module-associated protein Cmr3 n=1 Tax=Caldicellulosiruptor morganii TaxID=1387555 RepID=A0ABY7BMI1_9FIRM|nr:type III-B CRISPR module-associated protein Cmr3 [Caldicellulosiruptor morganii]WAM33725.1 type III-B CRISPR module-associated protein Cmr3 [Caldicellulosiruptor morganii]